MPRPDFDCWPDLRIVMRPLPWTWRLKPRLYADDVEGARGHCSFQWLFLTVEWWANTPMFPRQERADVR